MQLKGVTTGISASDRARTIRAAVKKALNQKTLLSQVTSFQLWLKTVVFLPGLGTQKQDVILLKLAGLEPSSVIVEILNEDGSMARKKDLIEFSRKHNLKIGTIEELIKYRVSNEKTIQRISQQIIKTKYGPFTSIFYKDILTSAIHFALIKNKISPEKSTLTRVHVQNTLTDAIGLLSPSSWPLDDALRKLVKRSRGRLYILRIQ